MLIDINNNCVGMADLPARGGSDVSLVQMSPGGSWRTTVWSTSSGVMKSRSVTVNVKEDVNNSFVQDNGYEVTHDGKCITVFSAPNYCDTMGNKGAFITLDGADMTPKFTTYEGRSVKIMFLVISNCIVSAVSHPNVKPMAYANSLLSLFG